MWDELHPGSHSSCCNNPSNGSADVMAIKEDSSQDKAQPSVLTPKDVAALEPLLPPRITRLWRGLLSKNPRLNIRMGSRLDDSVGPLTPAKT